MLAPMVKLRFFLSISSSLLLLISLPILLIMLNLIIYLIMKLSESPFVTLLTSVVKKLNSTHLLILFALLMILCAIFLLTSCGTTRAVVKHTSENSKTTISVSTSNPTSVQVSPVTSISMDSLKVNNPKK